MSDLSGNNYRIECPLCKSKFLNKDYSKHLDKEHFSEIFNIKSNKKELQELANKKEGRWFRPVEVTIKDKQLFYSPCCKKYYSRFQKAKDHSTVKKCYDNVIQEAKNDLERSIHVISTNIDISGNNNTIKLNNVVNNYNFYDSSNNLIETITTEACSIIEDARYNTVSYLKKLEKLRSIFKDHPEYDSETSTINSGYDTDESQTTLQRMDFHKEFTRYNEKIAKQLLEAKIDLSRRGLGLKTKEDSLKMKEEAIKQREAEEEFQREQEENERLEKIGNLRSEIKSYKDMIKRHENSHKENLNIMKMEGSGITQEIFDKEYCQLKKIDKYKKLLEEVQSKLAKLL
jgi:uncharacterized C2H2 Zn-finger protein